MTDTWQHAGSVAQKIVKNVIALRGVEAQAVQLHVRALRMLNRKDTTVREIASALRLSDAAVEEALGAGVNGATLSPHKRITCPMSRVVKLTEGKNEYVRIKKAG